MTTRTVSVPPTAPGMAEHPGPASGTASIFLDALFEHAPFALAFFDTATRFVRVNDSFAALVPAASRSLAGRAVRDVLPEIAAQLEPKLDTVLRDGVTIADAAIFDRTVPRSLSVSYYPVLLGSEVVGVGAIFVDVTAARAAEQERIDALAAERAARELAERANRTKDEFLATLSHELRTPLNAIVGWAHMLQTGQLGPVERNRAVETIVRNAKLQTSLVEDLLDVSRITTGKLRIDFERVALGSIVEAAVEGARPAAEAKNIGLRLEVSRHLGDVTGDAQRLQQVVWNLVSNAIKFTPRYGHVDVRATRVGEDAVIEVSDTGQGIEAEFLPFLFERFTQADGSTLRRHGGLGLGLAIARHLVEQHGGVIRAASAGPGKGATFSVTLPSAKAVERAPAPPRAEAPAAETRLLRGASVLVVDDDPDALAMMEALLCAAGAEVLAASSAAEAFVVLRQHRPDVLVCDIAMPEQDGYGFMRQLRAMGEAAGGWIPAIAVTGCATPKDSSEALLSGFQLHVSKPIDATRVLTAIAKLWRRGARIGER